jgi:hypothetical protein
MRKNLILLLLGVSTLVLLVFSILQNRELRILREKETKEPEVTARSDEGMHRLRRIFKDHARQKDSVGDREQVYGPEAMRQLQSQFKAIQDAEEASDKARPAEQSDQSPMANLAAMLNNPGMKEMLRSQTEAMLEVSYGPLLMDLQLSPEDRETFKELLIEKQMVVRDSGLDMIGALKGDQVDEEKMERIHDLHEGVEEKIREFLGEEDYEVFQQFEDTQRERMQVSLFQQSLPADHRLDGEQEDDLVAAMHEERKNFTFSMDFDPKEALDFSTFDEETVAAYMNEVSLLQEKYLARARVILSESQLEQFAASLKQQRAMQEMGMKMAIQMFASPSGKDEADK